ncbi:hypothetical protein NDU88_006079 [Pleurodeles waltl]|uniref:Secreted protein n=1 Tax=Pleurodeles waltl TaxID=8319 RepID=A0AAV7TEK6_PLEWA|nr:hypothetical protein NDU88_006079 [Pleurodeles waltl]
MQRCLLRLTAGFLALRRPLSDCGNAAHLLANTAAGRPWFVLGLSLVRSVPLVRWSAPAPDPQLNSAAACYQPLCRTPLH